MTIQKGSPLYIAQRQYRKGLKEAKRIIELELSQFDENGEYNRKFPPSIYNNLYQLTTLSAKFEALLEVEEEIKSSSFEVVSNPTNAIIEKLKSTQIPFIDKEGNEWYRLNQ